MKNKKDYILPDGEIDTHTLQVDFILSVMKQQINPAEQLKKFFANEEFTKREMWMFSRAIVPNPNCLSSAVSLLLKALDIITEEQGKTCRVFEDYLEIDTADSNIYHDSWMVDYDMGWPHGTVIPTSKPFLPEN